MGVLRSFGNKLASQVWNRERTKLHPDVARTALRKLNQVHAAERLDDLAIPPGNRLERLKGDRDGQYSIRINRQWRICFRWSEAGPSQVEITDYH